MSECKWNFAFESLQYMQGINHPDWIKKYEQQNEEKILKWMEWYKANASIGMPPGLVTKGGMMVDGNHRFEACCRLGIGFWCNLVRYDKGWKPIAGVVYIKGRKQTV